MKYLLSIICILCFLSCKKEQEQFDTLEALITHHHANAIKDSTEIIDLIKGEWRLIHYDCLDYTLSSEVPDATLSIDDNNKGQLYFKERDSLAINLDFEWRLEALTHPTEIIIYQFLTNPQHNAIYFQTFSKDYMSYYGFHGQVIIYKRQ